MSTKPTSTKPRGRAAVRTAMEARDADRMQRAPAQASLDVGGFGSRTQPNLF
jgi:hypothetical protein